MNTEKNTNEDYAIELLNITKKFGNAIINDNITLKLRRGEIHALLGENGAGKSTLMNVLFGLYRADGGTIKKDGKPVVIKNPNDANALGIGMVHQHFKLVGIFSALDNIILGDEPERLGFLKKDEARKKISELSDKYDFNIVLDTKADDMTVGMQQRVEILKMLYRDNDVLIFDEPTAVLTPQEIEHLLDAMKALADSGCSILFITHHLKEIMKIADRCTVISRGKHVGTVDIKDTTEAELAELMVGRKVNLTVDKKPMTVGETVLDIKNICTDAIRGKALNNVSMNIKSGEIVCIAGIDGNGQTELAHAITGMLPVKSGSIDFCGEDITSASIRKRSKLGISHIPEDRLKHGMISEYTMEDNMILQKYDEPQFTNSFGFLIRENIRSFAKKLTEAFDVRTSKGVEALAGSLSGGNQQKMVIARELEKNPKLLVAVQPVRGLDVGAIEYIYKQIVAHRDSGGAVLLISFDLEEVLNLSDRILVMFEGEIAAELYPDKTNLTELGLYMSGGKQKDAKEAAV